MRIEIEKIKGDPVELEESIEASSWDMDSSDVRFINTITFRCSFTRARTEILVTGSVKTHRLVMCSRCLSDAEQEVDQEFVLNYSVASLGEYLELDKDIREEILLNFPMRALCRSDCKGICSGCGANLNTEKCTCNK